MAKETITIGVGGTKRKRRASSMTKKQQTALIRKLTRSSRGKFQDKRAVDISFTRVGATAPDYNTGGFFFNPSTSDYIFPLNIIKTGSGSENRTGRKCLFKSLRVQGLINMDWTGDSTNLATKAGIYRIIIVQDRQPNGSLPSKASVLATKGPTGSEAGAWNSSINFDSMSRFKILKDTGPVAINPGMRPVVGSGTTTISFQHGIDFFIPLNIITNYQSESTVPVIGDISTNAIYLMLITPSNSAPDGISEPYVYFEGSVRLNFYT